MLGDVLDEDWMALPPWARNLAYRLACRADTRSPLVTRHNDGLVALGSSTQRAPNPKS
ncbi:hypothetical protein AB0D14_43705 [Streptomyces sp. NPDC048484]|uniref:hypothetical protein n=1 Tax=Streptomyces sp. NPDC048484 TaxID=3155146 RepID=UPI003424CEE0